MYSTEELQFILNSAFKKEKFLSEPKELYEPFRYILSFGGKRLRPLLVLLSCDMFGGKINHAIAPAIAIELFHNFTLMHDDIMDNAPIRRGKTTVHEKFNTNTAILSGDVMMVYAYRYLIKNLHPHILKNVLETFNETAIKVCEGQQLDMNYETQEATIRQYLKMIELKTAMLIAGSLKIGALISGASEKNTRLIFEFGKDIGIAFQLQDDILDTFGDGGKIGKKIGGDIVQNKKTFLYLKALELADVKTKRKLKQLYLIKPFVSSDKKVKDVIRIFAELNILSHAEKLKQNYLKSANQSLDSITIPQKKKMLIKKMSAQLLNREN